MLSTNYRPAPLRKLETTLDDTMQRCRRKLLALVLFQPGIELFNCKRKRRVKKRMTGESIFLFSYYVLVQNANLI